MSTRKSVLIITTLDIYHASGTLHNIFHSYIRGFVDSGYNVILFSSQNKPAHPCQTIPGNTSRYIKIRRAKITPFFFRVTRLLSRVLSTISACIRSKGSYAKSAHISLNGAVTRLWSSQSEFALIPFFITFAFESIVFMLFQRIFRRKSFSFIYGVEPQGSVIAFLLGKIFRQYSVSRLMGSSGYFIYKELRSRLKFFFLFPIKYLSLSPLCDLHIMTNDGTYGNVSLRAAGVHSEKLLFLPNGVDRSLPKDDPAPLIMSKGFNYLMTISRLVCWKRVDTTINVFKHLQDKNNYTDYHLVICGDGPELASLKSQAIQLGICDKVHFLGRTTHEKSMTLLQGSRGLLCFYDYSNLTNQLLESLALRIPVITYKDRALVKIFKDSPDILMVSRMQNPQDISARVSDFLQNYSASMASNSLYSWHSRMSIEISWIENHLHS